MLQCSFAKDILINAEIALPTSKSILNRMLVIAQLSGISTVDSFSEEASDVKTMCSLLQKVEFNLSDDEGIELNVGDAGTVMRFLTAVLAVTDGKWILTGSERMKQRPIKPLAEALQRLGASLVFLEKDGFPPLLIEGDRNLRGGKVQLDAGISSQFISALMMIGPYLKGGLHIELVGDIISLPYIRMTQSLMEKSGAVVQFSGQEIIIEEEQYGKVAIGDMLEPDWSAAAFWFETVALSPNSKVLLKGLRSNSVQGDSVLREIFAHLGVASSFIEQGLLLENVAEFVKEFDFDFSNCPDLAQAVIACCAALQIKGRFTGLHTLRVKETDRIEALHCELDKLGFGLKVLDNTILLDGTCISNSLDVVPLSKCYGDHRMAMSLSPIALIKGKIRLDEEDVVKKSYPHFWEDMVLAGMMIENC